MKDFSPVLAEIRDLCVRRCDTIFYAALTIVALLTVVNDMGSGETSRFVYKRLVDAVFYRESLRLFLWVQENPKYAAACLFGVFAGAVASILLKRPASVLYEASVYLALRTVATMLFGLNEKEVFKLYVDVLFDYYSRKTPPRGPRYERRRKSFIESFAPSGA
jgi:hypothetical protein